MSDLDAALGALAAVDHLLLVLDFDGVLSHIVDDADAARMLDGVPELLVALAEAPRTTVIVSSGRGLADLERRVPDPVVDAGVGLVGGHGTAARLPGTHPRPLADVEAATATLDTVEADLERIVGEAPDDGWWIERKDVSVCVHYRQVPEHGRAVMLDRVHERLDAARDEPPGWSVLDGKDIVELRPAGHDKGSALAWLLDEHATGHLPYVVGDDMTDEDAFEVAVAHGGGAVLVADEPRATHASWRLADPEAVRDLLGALASVR